MGDTAEGPEERGRAMSSLRRHRTVLLLSVAGGAIDAAAILGFGVLTAAQTGNTIILAVSLVRGSFVTGYLSAVSVAGYVLGAVGGELLSIGRRGPLPRPRIVDRTLLVELLILGVLFFLWHFAGPGPGMHASAVLVVLGAVIMGVQSAVVLHLHFGPKTTYVTGTLTKFSIDIVQRLGGALPSPRTETPGFAGAASEEGPWIYGIDWLVYALGAAASGLLFLRFNEFALLLPAAAIAAALAAETQRR